MQRRKLAAGFAAACVTLVFPSRRENGPTQYFTFDNRENGGAKWGIEYQRRDRVGDRAKQSPPSGIYRPKTYGFVPHQFGADRGDQYSNIALVCKSDSSNKRVRFWKIYHIWFG